AEHGRAEGVRRWPHGAAVQTVHDLRHEADHRGREHRGPGEEEDGADADQPPPPGAGGRDLAEQAVALLVVVVAADVDDGLAQLAVDVVAPPAAHRSCAWPTARTAALVAHADPGELDDVARVEFAPPVHRSAVDERAPGRTQVLYHHLTAGDGERGVPAAHVPVGQPDVR